jgi:opacity protein-like surface antigen
MKLAVVLFALIELIVGSAHPAFAQFGGPGGADPTATRALTIGAFAGGSYLKPDEGVYYNIYQVGYVGGLDITRRYLRNSISIEPTLGRSAGKDTSFSYLMGDVLIGRSLGNGSRIRPFGVLGIGYGVVHYPGQKHDNSILRNLGLGVSYDLTEHFVVRAHWEYQYWNVGTETDGFNPNGIQASLLYRFGFGLKRNRR